MGYPSKRDPPRNKDSDAARKKAMLRRWRCLLLMLAAWTAARARSVMVFLVGVEASLLQDPSVAGH